MPLTPKEIRAMVEYAKERRNSMMNTQRVQNIVQYNGDKPDGIPQARWNAMVAQINSGIMDDERAS